jgi:hypothetical protein
MLQVDRAAFLKLIASKLATFSSQARGPGVAYRIAVEALKGRGGPVAVGGRRKYKAVAATSARGDVLARRRVRDRR